MILKIYIFIALSCFNSLGQLQIKNMSLYWRSMCGMLTQTLENYPKHAIDWLSGMAIVVQGTWGKQSAASPGASKQIETDFRSLEMNAANGVTRQELWLNDTKRVGIHNALNMIISSNVFFAPLCLVWLPVWQFGRVRLLQLFQSIIQQVLLVPRPQPKTHDQLWPFAMFGEQFL